MILEIATLNVRAGLEREFEAAFALASPIIASAAGHRSHQLQRCVEAPNRYALLVNWESLEAHTVGFRGSPEYQLWRQLLHHFYDHPPSVEHYALVAQSAA
jgi:heme-degrading monooxygenase HmoA